MRAHALVRPTSDPTFDEVRRTSEHLRALLATHLERMAALPPGPTQWGRLADLNDPVRRALARWDRAVLAHTGTLPVAVDDDLPDEDDA